jgi:hypothetical protein
MSTHFQFLPNLLHAVMTGLEQQFVLLFPTHRYFRAEQHSPQIKPFNSAFCGIFVVWL